MMKNVLIFLGIFIFSLNYAQKSSKTNAPIYLFFNERTDTHFELSQNINSFEIATEDGLTYTFLSVDSIQIEKSIANIKFTNRTALKSILIKPTERSFIIVRKKYPDYLYYHSKLELVE